MVRYARLFREFFRACLVEEFEYRANFAANFMTTVFWLSIAVLTVRLYFFNAREIGGWDFYEVLALLGIFNALQGLIQFFLQPNMSRLVEHIRKGTLDFILLKPVDSQFYISLRHLAFWRLADVLLGFGLTGFALWRAGNIPDGTAVFSFLLLFSAAVMTVYSLWMGIMTLSFWAVKTDNLSFLFTSLFETARFPVTVYRGTFRFLLTYVFPVVLITTIPSKAILGQLKPVEALGSLFFSALLFTGARLFWKFALRYYTSASS